MIKPYLQTILQSNSHSPFFQESHFSLNIFKIYPNILTKTFINVFGLSFFWARWTSKYVNWTYHKKKQPIFWDSLNVALPTVVWLNLTGFPLPTMVWLNLIGFPLPKIVWFKGKSDWFSVWEKSVRFQETFISGLLKDFVPEEKFEITFQQNWRISFNFFCHWSY